MTDQAQRTPTDYRCDKCGMIRLVLDEPINLVESDEILTDEVWAVFRQLQLGDLWFSYVDCLFYTETSALEEVRRQVENLGGAWESDHDFRLSNGSLVSAAKVNVRL
jgi:hypothetical protein